MPAANNFRELLIQWSSTRRANGGWHALCGFSFQAAIYLHHLFDDLVKGRPPGQYEILSDVQRDTETGPLLIQCKRSVTNTTLGDAVKEACAILVLCCPDFGRTLRFQVCAQRGHSDLTTADLACPDDQDKTLWAQALGQFTDPSVIVTPDPYARLHFQLHQGGVRDPGALLAACHEEMARCVLGEDKTGLSLLPQRLSDLFRAYRDTQHAQRQPRLTVLSADMFQSDGPDTTSRMLPLGAPITVKNLANGHYCPRPQVLDTLVTEFLAWWHSLDSAAFGTIPVFWIEGRSGDGKSVLLLQLAARLSERKDIPTLALASDPNEAPVWLESLANNPPPDRLLITVDDLFNVRAPDEWHDQVLRACSLCVPNLAIITCGPSEQRRAFRNDLFAVTSFVLGPCTQQEVAAFQDFVSARRTDSPSLANHKSRLLVELLFELMRGESIENFAKKFAKRLDSAHLDLKAPARAILACNALQLAAPPGLLTKDQQQQAMEYLCSEEQLHFTEKEGGGLHLAHSALVWPLFRHWSETPVATSLTRVLADDLAHCLRLWQDAGNTAAAGSIIVRLAKCTLLSSNQIAAALNRLHQQSQDLPIAPLTTFWLVAASIHNTVTFREALVNSALTALETTPTHIHPASLPPLSRLCRTQGGEVEQHFEQMMETLLSAPPPDGWLRRALSSLLTHDPNCQHTVRYVRAWCLSGGDNHVKTGHLLAFMIANYGDDEAVGRRISAWLTQNSGPEAREVLTALVAAHPQDDQVKAASTAWITQNPGLEAREVLTALVAAHPQDDQVKAASNAWITQNPGPEASEVLKTLIAAHPQDDQVKAASNAWITQNPGLEAREVLTALVAAHPQDDQVKAASNAWITQNPGLEAREVLTALVAARPQDDQVKAASIAWITQNPGPEASEVLKTLIAAHPQDDQVKAASTAWITQNPGLEAREVLTALVAARPQDDQVKAASTAWITQNPGPEASEVLKTLIAAHPQDDQVKAASTAWITQNPGLEAREVLTALVAARPQDDQVKAASTAWITQNPGPEASEVLKTLIAARPQDEDIWRAARWWYELNPSISARSAFLTAALPRSGNDSYWEKAAEAHLAATDVPKNSKSSVLVALVSASRATPAMVTRLLRWRETRQLREQTFLTYQLGKILARLPDAAVAYLMDQSIPAPDRQAAADAINKVLKKHPTWLEALAGHHRCAAWCKANPRHPLARQLAPPSDTAMTKALATARAAHR